MHLTSYEELLQLAYDKGVYVFEHEFEGNMSGYYCDNVAFIDKYAGSDVERKCILAEELGHHLTTVGDITGEDTLNKRKQELNGRKCGYNIILPLEDIIDALITYRCDNLPALAEQLDVTPEYLQEALIYYGQKYGPELIHDGYLIKFTDCGIVIRSALDEIV